MPLYIKERFMLTFLIIIILISFLWGAIKSIMKGHISKKHDEYNRNIDLSIQDILNKEWEPPTWVNNKKKLETFLSLVKKDLVKEGFNIVKVNKVLTNKNALVELLSFSGFMEKRGSTFSEQTIAAVEFVKRRIQMGN